jgi:Fe-Mn family superoxide dismutase
MFNKIVLPYDYDALEPYIDAETVKVHYGKHLQKYEDNLNKLLEGYEEYSDGKTLYELLSNIEALPKEIRQGVINNGGGVANHNLYFATLSKDAKMAPEGKLLEQINEGFGNLETLKDQMTHAAINHFGSGYAFLVKDQQGKLSVKTELNQNCPVMEGYIPLLTIDVWEHAYYLKYRNLRTDYVNAIWNIIDWAKVEGLYSDGRTM